MQTVRCYDAQGNAADVAVDQLEFTPAVYGIFIENEQILLLRHPQTKRWVLPGAWLGVKETPHELLRRVFRQLLGITPEIGPLLFLEDRYELDRRQGWHVATLYHAVERPTTAVAAPVQMRQNSIASWLPLNQVQRHEMQFGYEAIQAGELRLRLRKT